VGGVGKSVARAKPSDRSACRVQQMRHLLPRPSRATSRLCVCRLAPPRLRGLHTASQGGTLATTALAHPAGILHPQSLPSIASRMHVRRDCVARGGCRGPVECTPHKPGGAMHASKNERAIKRDREIGHHAHRSRPWERAPAYTNWLPGQLGGGRCRDTTRHKSARTSCQCRRDGLWMSADFATLSVV
jgi:hypothetical protein